MSLSLKYRGNTFFLYSFPMAQGKMETASAQQDVLVFYLPDNKNESLPRDYI